MNFIKRLFNKTTREQPQTIKKNWRVGMWVQTQDNKTGILFKLGDTCEIHIVDRTSGETVEVVQEVIEHVRQAKWGEIPECRRRGITKEQAEALGYGS